MQQFTKKEIKLTMLRLLQTKPLDSIKVRNIIDECGISRNSTLLIFFVNIKVKCLLFLFADFKNKHLPIIA